mgnify:FL=1
MSNVLKGWLADNAVTVDNKEDKILLLESAGNLTEMDILERMSKEITGLKEETLYHAMSLYNRIVMESLLNGYTVNTGLFYASPSFQGVIDGGVWNKEKNTIKVNFQQGKTLREEIAKTKVEILGEKADIMYVLEVEDKKTGLKDGTVSPGFGVIIRGRNLKIAGSDEKVGVYLINDQSSEEKLPDYQIIHNKPSELTIQIPTGLLLGAYTLRITTQFSAGKNSLKTPRSLDIQVNLA